jgi:type IV pilus assembly protein PilM
LVTVESAPRQRRCIVRISAAVARAKVLGAPATVTRGVRVMASGTAIWGIDVGQCALKAIKLRPAEGGKVEAVAFDVIEHPKILSQPDADRDELISSALEKFASRNEWQGDKFVIGVPGQQTFARFCKMPPIDLKKDAKKIHDLVRYEASQQIPFDIEDVIWDYQLFTSEGSPDVEVGIFAIRKDLIRKHLGFFAAVNIAPLGVQTIPAALYNFCQFDGQAAGAGGATVMVDVGAQNTDLVIVEANAAWTRNIPLGGNSFTEALVRAFKLSFAKAESLKRTAATSKYARQIFQAMRPVFADLVAEIQRSVGFYSSTHRDVELKRVLALGNAFRLPGLQKYLENNLTIPGGVAKLEKFNQLMPTATINAPQFTENVLSFAAAYGLALQGLGLAPIKASLLPAELARIAVWQKKRPFFIATAAALLIAAGIPWIANSLDRQALASDQSSQSRDKVTQVLNQARAFQKEFSQARTDTGARKADAEKLCKLQEYKLVLPRIVTLVNEALPPINPPELAQVHSAEEFKKLIESDTSHTRFPRYERRQFIVESLKTEYVNDVEAADVNSTMARPEALGPAGAQSAGPPRGAMGKGRFQAPPGFGSRGRPGAGRPGGGTGSKGSGAPAAGAGFIVRVEGRLLYGRTQPEAIEWFKLLKTNLLERGQQAGLGFHIPNDDPKDATKNSIGIQTPMKYYQGAAIGIQPVDVQQPGSAGPALYPDPLTGEDMASDWKIKLAFKVKLGEKGAAPVEPEAAGKPGAGPRGGRGPAGRMPGRPG